MSLLSMLAISIVASGFSAQDAASEAKAEIGAKYSQYDRAIRLNDAAKLLEFYSNETMEDYAEEVRGFPKRTRKDIQEALGSRVRKSNKAREVTALKGHRTTITQFRLGGRRSNRSLRPPLP